MKTAVDGFRALGNGFRRNDLAWVVQILRILFLKNLVDDWQLAN